jgi:hypothetical protein
MSIKFHFTGRWLVPIAATFFAVATFVVRAEPAADLAAALRAKEEGSKFIRVRMQSGAGENQVLQLQIKSRVSNATSDIVYQVLFPKERKGESVLLHRSGNKFTGTLFIPPNTLKPISSAEMNKPLFGSALSYEEIIDSPYTWSQQTIVGAEDVDGNPCQILESKHGKDRSSSYASVKTWIDPRRMVPLRIEKYDASGKLVRRINTTRILLDGGDSLPADLKVYGPGGSVTQIIGARLKRGLNYADSEFTADGLKQLTAPPASAE